MMFCVTEGRLVRLAVCSGVTGGDDLTLVISRNGAGDRLQRSGEGVCNDVRRRLRGVLPVRADLHALPPTDPVTKERVVPE